MLDVRNICQNDNMKAINSAVSVDLTGQIAAESVGPRILSGAGGQTSFAMGAGLSRGGRSITVLPSTASNGAVSRIVPLLDAGTIVTVPRIAADTIITEYGIARLKGLTQRQRALDLIGIAHPDHRAELKKKAEELLAVEELPVASFQFQVEERKLIRKYLKLETKEYHARL